VRSAFHGTLTLVPVLATLAALGGCGGAPAASTPAPLAAVVDSNAPHSAAEEAARYASANALRARILAATVWENPGKGAPCDPGVLRTFRHDSGDGYAQVDSAIRALERTIIAFGVDQPVDVPAGHALLRTVLAWEAGAERPRWDMPAGQAPHRAIPAGLTGEFFNESTKKCEPLSALDTVTLVIPEVTRFEPPKSLRTARAAVFQGDSGLIRARNAFFAAHEGDTSAVFLYTGVKALVLWRDYAVIAVDRPAERQAVVQLRKGAGGATYIFRREKDEWRLLVIARTWG
jgi:hypothetical protein